MQRRELFLDIYNLVLGLFLFTAPWVFASMRQTASADIWASGAFIVMTSVAAIVAFSEWEEWLNLALGLWLLLSPWVLGFAHTTAMHVCVGVGAVVVYLAALELWLVHYDRPSTPV